MTIAYQSLASFSECSEGLSSPLKAPLFENGLTFKVSHILLIYTTTHIPYLRSMAVLAAWDGHSEQAIGQLREAAGLAAEMGLPAEQWQVQAALGSVYETAGEQAQAHTAFREAARIIQELAQGIKDETLRVRFLTGPQIHPVLQHAQRLATSIPDDHTEPGEL